MGRRSQNRATGLTLEERQAYPIGNDKSLDAIEIQEMANRTIRMVNKFKRSMRIGRVGV